MNTLIKNKDDMKSSEDLAELCIKRKKNVFAGKIA